MKKLLIFLMTILSIAIVFTASAFCGYLYITPSSYIKLNGEPSIKYSVNAYGRVLNVETNSENDELIKDLNLNNKEISEAIKITVDKLITSNSMSQYNNSGLIISVTNNDINKAERLEKKLKLNIKNYLERKVEIKNLKLETKIMVK